MLSIGVVFAMAKLGISSGASIKEMVSASPILLLQNIGNIGTVLFALPIALLLGIDENQKIVFSQRENYCIFSNTSPKERVAGRLLIKFLNRDDQNFDCLTFTGNLPSMKTILENEENTRYS